MTDEERLDDAFTRHYRDIAGYFLRRCPTRADADDATAEVFAVAWRRIGRLPREPDTRLWLFGVARRVLADQQRSHRRRNRLHARLNDTHTGQVDPGTGTLDALMIREALWSLSDGDRELLGFAAWEGLSPAEIARVLGIPVAVVSARLYRARRRLEHRLKHIENKETLACPTS